MKLKLLLLACAFTGALIAQPTPFARFTFDENFLDEQENVSTTLIGTTVPTIVEDATRGMVASFPGGTNDDGNGVSMSINSYAFAEVTYNVWVKFNSLDTWSRIFTFGTEAVSGAEPEFWATPANGRLGQRMSVTIDAGTDFAGVENVYGDEPVATDTWFMFTAALNATNLKLWVDGVPSGDSLHDSGSSPQDQVIEVAYLGKSVWPDPILNGFEDNFTIYGSFLTDEEVAAIYTAEYMEPGAAVKTVDNDLDMVVYSANNQILIINPMNAVINSVKIYSITGSLVLETNNFNGALNHNLVPNVYIAHVKTNLGNVVSKIAVH